MYWVDIGEDYLSYLRGFEKRIPFSDYGQDRFKPFFGVLFEKGDLRYVTQISHAQPRHEKLTQQKDFYKIYDSEDSSRLIAVVNLNYMFPVPISEMKRLIYKYIDQYRVFKNPTEKSKYIDLLKMELAQINKLNLDEAAKSIYADKYRYPERPLARRCLDYKELEECALRFNDSFLTDLPSSDTLY